MGTCKTYYGMFSRRITGGKGSGQGGEGRNKHGKMERVENKEADHMQAGC